MEIRDLVLSVLLFSEQWGEGGERCVDHSYPDWGWDNLVSINEIQNTLFRLHGVGEMSWKLNRYKSREWVWKRLPHQALLEKLGYRNPYILACLYSFLVDQYGSPEEKRIISLDEAVPWKTLLFSGAEEAVQVLRSLIPLYNSAVEPITAIQIVDGVECFVILRDPHEVLIENFFEIEDFLRK